MAENSALAASFSASARRSRHPTGFRNALRPHATRYMLVDMSSTNDPRFRDAPERNKRSSVWPRFWVSRTGHIDLSDAGFMVDPTTAFAQLSSESKPRSLIDLEHYPALALLGEPGMGKSTSLEAEAIRMRENNATDHLTVHVDLRAYSSEELLYRRLFESPELSLWKDSTSRLTLYIDSLDEALLRIDSIANLFADELPRLPTSRLSFRVACRTAVWPALTLERALMNIWGESSVGVFELAPLRRIDVLAAADDREISGNFF